MKALIALAIALMTYGLAVADPNDGLLDRIEANVTMPVGADRLEAYARYYALTDSGSEVTAVYLKLGNEQPGRRWVNERELPIVLDGGCGVVTVMADAATATLRSVFCNDPG